MTFSATTRPTSTALGDMIESHEGVINSALAKNGITPPTSGYGFTYLKLTNIYCVLAEVYRTDKGNTDTAEAYQTLCNDRMTEIKENPDLISPDIVTDGGVSHSTRPDVKYEWQVDQW